MILSELFGTLMGLIAEDYEYLEMAQLNQDID